MRLVKLKVDINNENPIETKEEFKNKETDLNVRNNKNIENKDNKGDKKEKENEEEEKVKAIGILKSKKIRGVIFSCLAFFCYCSGEGTVFYGHHHFSKEPRMVY